MVDKHTICKAEYEYDSLTACRTARRLIESLIRDGMASQDYVGSNDFNHLDLWALP
jgi:hypothetical protein